MSGAGYWILGLGAASVICCSGVLFFGWKSGMAQEANGRGAETFAEKELPVLLKDWNYREMIAKASPELLAESPEPITKQWFDLYRSKLGEVKRIHGSRSEGTRFYTGTNGSVVETSVVTPVDCEKDKAEVRLLLVKRGGNYRIRAFRVKSEALSRALKQ